LLVAPLNQSSNLCPLLASVSPQEGDVEAAEQLVASSSGLERTRSLAAMHADEAAAAIQGMSPPATAHAAEHREALVQVTRRVLNRRK
jgi:geranyl diphosphate synthase